MPVTDTGIEQSAVDYKAASDYDIIKEIIEGDINLYEIIMRRYNLVLYRIARSIVLDEGRAKDVVQEAYIKAYQKLSDFHGNTGFSAWLGAIVRNEALMVVRKLKNEKLHMTVLSDDDFNKLDTKIINFSEHSHTMPDSAYENSQLASQINRQIDCLPEHFRVIFVLRSIAQLSTEETAQIMNIGKTTVRTRLFRAKIMLQKKIIQQCDESVYEFGGHDCNKIVAHVLATINNVNK